MFLSTLQIENAQIRIKNTEDCVKLMYMWDTLLVTPPTIFLL